MALQQRNMQSFLRRTESEKETKTQILKRIQKLTKILPGARDRCSVIFEYDMVTLVRSKYLNFPLFQFI